MLTLTKRSRWGAQECWGVSAKVTPSSFSHQAGPGAHPRTIYLRDRALSVNSGGVIWCSVATICHVSDGKWKVWLPWNRNPVVFSFSLNNRSALFGFTHKLRLIFLDLVIRAALFNKRCNIEIWTTGMADFIILDLLRLDLHNIYFLTKVQSL